jgi:farnesyl-diphosphate farnesyltransferase
VTAAYGSAAVPRRAESDWEFCQRALEAVSRTFSQPIQLLPELPRRALTLGYLLCRVADSVEDSTGLEPRVRDEAFTLFQAILRGEEAPSRLACFLADAEMPRSERELLEELPRVLREFSLQRSSVQATTVRWVSEMADGMRLYGRRTEGREFSALYGLADLERYCFFVAGTVGHLITELFSEACEQPELERRLRPHAESFGLGLQLVNIVKDVTDDYARGVCFLPRQLCRDEGFEPEELLLSEHRAAALRVVARVAGHAALHLREALEYTLLLPREQPGMRLFCLLPLWMAIETLSEATGNPAALIPEQKVKISRDTVARIISECGRLCADDAALRARFEELLAEQQRRRVEAFG